jgi:predicted nucleic acid-binding protein
MIGLTLDTGALIALERRGQRIGNVLWRAHSAGLRVTAPAAVVTEWWRGRTDMRDRILGFLFVEPLSAPLAKVAGEALAAVKSATAVDAIVMASAASRGDIVYTSDVGDLERLRAVFPGVRVLSA